MEDFESELKLSFLEEAEQLLSDVERTYLDLESNPDDATILDQIFRVAHNLKGSSKAVGFNEVGQFAHQFENLLLKLKNQELKVTPPIVSLLLRSNDHLSNMIHQLKESLDASFDSTDLLNQIEIALKGDLEHVENKPTFVNTHIEEHTPSVEPTPAIEMNHAEVIDHEDVITPEKTAIPHASAIPASSSQAKASTTSAPVDESIRVSLSRLEKLLRVCSVNSPKI